MNQKVAIMIGAAALVAAVLIGAAISNDSSPSVSGQPSLDVPFTYFDGRAGNLADFAGRPLVINFWASWCPACVAEMPDFETVHDALGDRVAFLGLAMQETDQDAARALIEQTGVTYSLGQDPDGSIFASFGGIAMPTTVLIDEKGTVVETHHGALFARDLEAIIRAELLRS
jgi:thiol-disulfide isomerase/thioredoxin